MTGAITGFAHRFVPAGPAGPPVTLLLLHGTGGDEEDMIPLGRALAPGAALLSPRGKVLENGNPRFFRRLAEGVFDEEDLVLRTHELAEFVEKAAATYGFDAERVVAVGYSNGANIAASLMLLHPDLLAGGILLRPMVPFVPPELPDLMGKQVLVAGARHDPVVPPSETERLVALLREAGADVVVQWQPGGHAVGPEDLEAARRWLAAWRAAPRRAT